MVVFRSLKSQFVCLLTNDQGWYNYLYRVGTFYGHEKCCVWTNVAWTNGTGTRTVKYSSTNLKCPLPYFPWGGGRWGGGGWIKVETKAISVQQAGPWTELGNKSIIQRIFLNTKVNLNVSIVTY